MLINSRGTKNKMGKITEKLFEALEKELKLLNEYLDQHQPIEIDLIKHRPWNKHELTFKSKSRMSQENTGQKKARKIMKNLYPEVDWNIYMVHHIDGDPTNNDQNNLEIVTRKGHYMVHRYIKTYY